MTQAATKLPAIALALALGAAFTALPAAAQSADKEHCYGVALKGKNDKVAFLAVGQVNGCTYCTAAHSVIADKKTGVPAAVLQAIRAGQPIPDARLAALHALVTEMVTTHGRPSPATVDSFLSAGFQERDLLYIVLAIAVKTLSNFSNHAFATPVDAVFSVYKVD